MRGGRSRSAVLRDAAGASRSTAAGAHPIRHCEARSAAAIQSLAPERLPLGRFAALAMTAKAVSGPVLRDGPPGLLSTNGFEAAAPKPLARRSGVGKGRTASRRAASRSTAAGARSLRHCEARSAAAIQSRRAERSPLARFASLAMTERRGGEIWLTGSVVPRHCEARSAAAIQGLGPERLPLDCFAPLAMTAKRSTATAKAVYPNAHTRSPGRAGDAIRQRRNPCAICR
jgi:hypothetical protein